MTNKTAQRQEQQRQQQEAARQAAQAATQGRDVSRDPWEITIPEPPPPPPPPPSIEGGPTAPLPKPPPPPSPDSSEPPQRPPAETFKVPEGAKLIEETAQGKPAVYQRDKEKYYAPDSTMYKIGYQTWSEYLRSQQKGTPPPHVAVETHTGQVVHIRRQTAKTLSILKGEEQFKLMVKLGLIPKGSTYVPGKNGKWSYITPHAMAAAETKAEAQTYPRAIILEEDKYYSKAVLNLIAKSRREAIQMERQIKRLPATERINIGEEQLSKAAALKIVGGAQKEYQAQLEKAMDMPPASREAAIATATARFNKVKEAYKGTPAAQIAAEILVPGVLTYHTYQRYATPEGKSAPGDSIEKQYYSKITSTEVAALAFMGLLDAAAIIFPVGRAAIAARTARGLSTAARIKTASGAFVVAAASELIAPITMIRHPIRTAKTLYEPIETIFRKSKVPLASLETSYSTVRLPIRQFKSAEEALKFRDEVTQAAIQGRKAVVEIGGTKVTLSKATVQKLGTPVAVHSTPDIRPFMEGVAIKSGREGGLYVAPNLHTRFTVASAYGDLPKGNIKGALIIRDEKVLQQLAGSKKIYAGTAEIESVIKGGRNLPKPTQVLMTRDAAGDKLALLVFGPRFSAGEIAAMKIGGSADAIRGIFTPSARISKSGKAIAANIDEVIELGRERIKLEKQLARVIKKGNDARAVRIRQSISQLSRRIDDIRARINRLRVSPSATRLLFARVGDRRVIDRNRIIPVPPRREPVRRTDRATAERITVTRTRRIPPETRRALPPPERRLPPPSDRRVPPPERRIPPPPRGRIPPPARIPPAPTRVPPPPTRIPPPPTRVPPPPTRVPPPPTRVPPPPTRVPPPPLPSGASDTAKRERIKQAQGAVVWNMGKLMIKGRKLDCWHVRLDTEEHIVVLGKVPEGATEVDGPGSAYKTARRIVGGRGFPAFMQRHGAVTAGVRPSGVPKGVDIRFKPTRPSSPKRKAPKSPSVRIGKQFYTRMGRSVAISRRPLRRMGR